tara:strand:- start:145 stop:738 length:594 start_codon:yes stop_codon:yes gene_type:complete
MDLEKIHRINNATIFLLPLIPFDKGIFDYNVPYHGKGSRLLNAYVYDVDIPKYQKNHVSVVHSNFQDIGFKVFEKYLENSKYYADSYDICNTQYGVKIFKVPSSSLLAYEAFLRGEYSRYPLHDMASVLYYNYIGQQKYLEQVFQKDDELRKKKEETLDINLEGKELWSIYDPEYDLLHKDLKDKISNNKLKPNKNL